MNTPETLKRKETTPVSELTMHELTEIFTSDAHHSALRKEALAEYDRRRASATEETK